MKNISWSTIKTSRDFFLKNSDWTQLSDVSLTEEEKQDWASYRQQLRDITKNFRMPNEVRWPESPTIKKIKGNE
jgi:hypothetical protein